MSGNSGEGVGYSLTNARGPNSRSSSASPTSPGSARDFGRGFYPGTDQSSRGRETALLGGNSAHPFHLFQNLSAVLPRGFTRDSGAPRLRSSSPPLGSEEGDVQTKDDRPDMRLKSSNSYDSSSPAVRRTDVDKGTPDFHPQPPKRKPVARRESKKDPSELVKCCNDQCRFPNLTWDVNRMLYMKGETKSRAYCEHCYRQGMTGMKGRLCIEDSGAPRCFSRAAYALPGQKPRRCTLHKQEGMLHIHKASAREARRRLQKGYYEEAMADGINEKASSSQISTGGKEQAPQRGRLGEDDAASALLSIARKPEERSGDQSPSSDDNNSAASPDGQRQKKSGGASTSSNGNGQGALKWERKLWHRHLKVLIQKYPHIESMASRLAALVKPVQELSVTYHREFLWLLSRGKESPLIEGKFPAATDDSYYLTVNLTPETIRKREEDEQITIDEDIWIEPLPEMIPVSADPYFHLEVQFSMYRKVKRKRDEELTNEDYHMSEQFQNLIALVEDDLRNQQHIVRENDRTLVKQTSPIYHIFSWIIEGQPKKIKHGRGDAVVFSISAWSYAVLRTLADVIDNPWKRDVAVVYVSSPVPASIGDVLNDSDIGVYYVYDVENTLEKGGAIIRKAKRIPDEKVVTLGNDLTFLKFNDAYYEEHKNDRGRIKIEKTLRTIYPEEGSVVKREERELEIRWDSRDRIHVEVTRGTQGPRRVQHATRFMVPVPVEPAWLENTITQLGRSLSIGDYAALIMGLWNSKKGETLDPMQHLIHHHQLDIHAFEGSLGANALESLVFFIGLQQQNDKVPKTFTFDDFTLFLFNFLGQGRIWQDSHELMIELRKDIALAEDEDFEFRNFPTFRLLGNKPSPALQSGMIFFRMSNNLPGYVVLDFIHKEHDGEEKRKDEQTAAIYIARKSQFVVPGADNPNFPCCFQLDVHNKKVLDKLGRDQDDLLAWHNKMTEIWDTEDRKKEFMALMSANAKGKYFRRSR